MIYDISITEITDLQLELDILKLNQELCGLEFEKERRFIEASFKSVNKSKSKGKVKRDKKLKVESYKKKKLTDK
jgi:hypothetical protein